MSKSIEITPAIAELIRKNVGHDVAPNTILVYETVALSTRPVNKRGSLFDKAVHTPSTLQAMADFVTGGGNVPLHTLHQQGDEIPVGRVFYAALTNAQDGHTELRSLFFILKQHKDLIGALESSALDEVSISANYQHIYCSECDFDYMSDEATMMHIYERTCESGHTLGEKGVHARLVGLDNWAELSLVSRGASPGAQIKPRAKRLLADNRYQELVASGKNPDALLLQAKSPLDNSAYFESNLSGKSKDTEMDPKEFIADLSAKATEIAQLKADVATEKAKTVTAEAALTKANADLAAEKTAKEAAEAKLADTIVVNDDTVAYLQDVTKKVRVAAGETNVEVTEKDPNKLVASLKELGPKLVNIPILGVAASADANKGEDKGKASYEGAFDAFSVSTKK